jgi:hypothetical protein
MRSAEPFFALIEAELPPRRTLPMKTMSHVIFDYIENRYDGHRGRPNGRLAPDYPRLHFSQVS